MYCKKCGNEIEDNSNFCSKCGTSVNLKNNERNIIYDGEVHKCPNCGEVLKAFDVKCSSCGFEIRDRSSSSSLREFYLKLEQIEAGREKKKIKSIFVQTLIGDNLSKTDEQKISLIRSFIIPNTKEDLYEFLILSKSNIEIDLYENTQLKTARLAVSDAWKAKFEQAYQKARLLFKNDERMVEIQAMYDEVNKSINNAKWRTLKLVGIIYGVIIAIAAITLIIVAICGGFSSDNTIKDNENDTSISENVGEYEKDLNSNLNITENEVNNNENITENDAPINNIFDEKSVIENLKVTEYKYDMYGTSHSALIIRNESNYNLKITADVKFYDKDGNLVGANSKSNNGVGKGTETILRFGLGENYEKIECELSVKEDTTCKCIVDKLIFKSTSAKNKEILEVTNNSEYTGQSMQGHAIFFKNGNVVDMASEYLSDDEGEFKSKDTITKQFDSLEEYDTVKFYFTGYGK